jgi:hypothetical protein
VPQAASPCLTGKVSVDDSPARSSRRKAAWVGVDLSLLKKFIQYRLQNSFLRFYALINIKATVVP